MTRPGGRPVHLGRRCPRATTPRRSSRARSSAASRSCPASTSTRASRPANTLRVSFATATAGRAARGGRAPGSRHHRLDGATRTRSRRPAGLGRRDGHVADARRARGPRRRRHAPPSTPAPRSSTPRRCTARPSARSRRASATAATRRSSPPSCGRPTTPRRAGRPSARSSSTAAASTSTRSTTSSRTSAAPRPARAPARRGQGRPHRRHALQPVGVRRARAA